MNPKLLETEIQQFIIENTGKPIAKLALMKNPFPYIEWREVVNQVAAREKAKDKLPTWFNTNNIIYPEKISIEQTSSETAAQYKASLVSGESLIDLTGGFGIDDYYFAKNINKVSHCELNLELSAVAAHNFQLLGANGIECVPGDSTEALKLLERHWDWMYIDPSRRSNIKGKVFLLKDCLPNVPEQLDFYFKFSRNIMIKTAPLLDILAGLSELHSVKAIHIVALNNEVKELLWILEKDYTETPIIEAVAINKEETSSFVTQWGNNTEATYALPKKHLYEPNSAVMKSGAFDAVSTHFKIDKLHKHSQLYTSDNLVAFTGRRFIINNILPYQKNEMKQHIEGNKMNVTVRNFPQTVADIQKKWKIKDGGDTYAFFTTNLQNEKIVLLCAKI
ncbi:class I SAM-dependent methyltransferase [Flavobacterium arcticum]|uniref:Class I SAM-dependent methyltransferase n=1 Tax=Flavobacterium arcticum TaxID=1784713 RepID=A0A345HDZ0_9FLAO|nr:class I SAM-dependent methyltransferase [Flavobacterium arcticum]AXG74800.1 class I SAM-dependent methyltransferase [Flavobacterium arcticum]